jgi:predicted nucleic-acid-binding protein
VIGVDTNVLLRHLLQDDPVQSPIASRFLEERTPEDPAFIGGVVIAELVWTLGTSYRVARADCHRIVRALLASGDLVVEGSVSVRRALWDAEEANADLADAIIAHRAIDAGCDGTVTFDRRAQRLPGMLPVV